MEYFVADSYINLKRVGEPFEKNGKMYVNVFKNCPKCGGLGIMPSQSQCFYCHGTKGQVKSVRVYTAEEKEKYEGMYCGLHGIESLCVQEVKGVQ